MRNVLATMTICLIGVLGCNGNGGSTGIVLDSVDVGAPAVNCIFDEDCTITVSDTTDELVIMGMAGSGFLQSRTFPVGESGTVGAGLYGYEYRIDLREVAGITHITCAASLSLDFGPVSRLDYDGDGTPEDMYVVTSGGLGNVAPSSVEKSGDTLTFSFSPGVCPGASSGRGDSSFFFGLASAFPPRPVVATVWDSGGHEYTLDARAPDFEP